jgi:hypothetical protein
MIALPKLEDLPFGDRLTKFFQPSPNNEQNQNEMVNPFIPLVLLLLPLLFINILNARYSHLTKEQPTPTTPRLVDNVLLITNAYLDSTDNPSSIIVTFNNPVEAHQVAHYFSIAPKIPGEWKQYGNDPNSAQYMFEKKFKGSYLSLYLTQGLTSTNNKALLQDYERTFTTNYGLYEPYSRVKNVPAGKNVHLFSNGESIKLYRSDAAKLLRYITYELDEKVERGSIYDGTYPETAVEHPTTSQLTNLTINEDNTLTLSPGVYYVEGDSQDPYFVVISSFGTVLRQDDKQVIFGAFDIATGNKITDGVTFGLYNLGEQATLLRDFVYTEKNNSVTLNYPTRLDAVIGIYKDEIAFIPVELPSSYADIRVSSNLDTDAQIFIYTDRPLYKPGDRVFVRGVVRQDSDSLYKLPTTGQTIYLRYYDRSNNPTLLTTTLDEYGTFYTSYVLPKDEELPYAQIQASITPFSPDNYRYTTATFEIKKFIKPPFEIKTTVEQSEYLRSDKLRFTITGNYFDSKPLANKEVSYKVYSDNYYEVEKAVYNKNFNITSPGGMCGGGGFEDYFGEEYKAGKVVLNNNGQAMVEVSADENSLLGQKNTLVATAIDDAKNEITSGINTIVHAAEYTIFFIPSSDRYSAGEEVVVPFYAESLTGQKMSNTTFSYTLSEYEYDEYTENPGLLSGKVLTDANGKGIVIFTLPTELKTGLKQLVISGKDSRDNTVQNLKSISILSSEERTAAYDYQSGNSQTYLKMTSNQTAFKVGDTVTLNIESPQELDALLTLERGRIYTPQFIHLNKGSNTLAFTITEDLSPSITVVLSFFADNQYRTEGLSLNVPAMHKLLNIDLTLNKTRYSPDETAELRVRTTDASGAPVAAQMSVGVVDKAIYALRQNATPPVHSSFYYFRPRRTNASSSLTGMGDWGGRGGGGGDGGSNLGSDADLLYWNPTLRTDASGDVTISIPLLGHQTIWKINVIGSTVTSQVGQADTEFVVNAE